MNTEFRDFTEESFPLVRDLVSSCFGNGVLPTMQQILDNPMRREIPSAGCIGFEDGKAVCFMASIVRRMYWGQEEIKGNAGSTLCKSPDGCSLPLLLELQERAIGEQYQCRLKFGNTCIYVAKKMNEAFGWKDGPKSWTEMRFGIIHPLRFFWLLFLRKILHRPQPGAKILKVPADEQKRYAVSGVFRVHRLNGFEDARLDAFWKRYLAGNRGIVASRDSETMNWLFGKALSSGKSVLLALFNGDDVEGFIILRPMSSSPCRWQIMDMIALENAPERLDILLSGARRFLKKETNAISLESTGYPDFVQPILQKHMPHLRKTGHNRFEWISDDRKFIQLLEQSANSRESWFFGPFDGDYCL